MPRNEQEESIDRRGHTTMASCAASIAIQEAAAAGVPEADRRVIGMRAGWAVLAELGYDIPAELQAQMAVQPVPAV